MTKTDTLQMQVPAKQLTYLALGDSYTIGESVAQTQNFPYQLVQQLDSAGIKVAAPEIIATTGWTTSELQSAIQTANLHATFDVVTLLIGVNNQYRGESIDTYRTEFKALLQTAIAFAGGNVKRVFVLSIPDWGATPYGLQSGRGQASIGKQIDNFNAVNQEETLLAGAIYTDITPESRTDAADASFIAADGLHPSGKMYQQWVKLLAPAVELALR